MSMEKLRTKTRGLSSNTIIERCFGRGEYNGN